MTSVCGFNDLGVPNAGVFDCGFAIKDNACVSKCVWKRCAPD
jgi:hypothetical protein